MVLNEAHYQMRQYTSGALSRQTHSLYTYSVVSVSSRDQKSSTYQELWDKVGFPGVEASTMCRMILRAVARACAAESVMCLGILVDLSWHFGDGGCSLGVGNEGWRDTEGDSVCKTMYNTTTFEVHDHDHDPFEVQDHDAFVDHMDEYHDVHEMQNDVQHNYVVDSDADYTSDSNIIPYDQYVEDNEEHVVQCNASSVRNDALMSILDEMHEQGVQSRLTNKPDMLMNDSVTSELARYKELVGEYEKRAKFELTDRERKIDEQMRIIISDRNRKETSLKSELHSAQILLSSTVDHYKSKTVEVTLLKKDFKQKEDKFLEEFLDLKKLKDKIEDRLYKQDQSIQTVHMLCKPKSFYDEKHKVAIGYKNPRTLCMEFKSPLKKLRNGRIFDQMNNEVDKNTVDKQCAEIEKKNLLIENENLIVNCLSTQLLYDVEKSRCLDLEADMSKEAPDFNSFFKIKNLEHQIKEKDNVIRHLKDLVASVNDRSREPYNAVDVTALIEQNDCDRVELEKVKQHYKELYDSIKITRAHTSEKTSTMLNEIESLKAQLRSKEPCFTSDYVKPKVLALGMYAIDVKPIPHPLKNNRSAHLNYISLLKEIVETELLECVIGTCPKSFNERDNKAPSTPVTRKKQVTFSDKPGTSSSNTQKHKVHQRVQQTNIPVLPSTGVNDSQSKAIKARSNTKKNKDPAC
ncbi:hypothetical protein Tco_0973874 [Tanacetum coccineum]|uniref:Uncharacterized protein n=1 Tax=Tanacetum coccineum TaxID=301880 RepID=A0ABQ5EA22_9ASTR